MADERFAGAAQQLLGVFAMGQGRVDLAAEPPAQVRALEVLLSLALDGDVLADAVIAAELGLVIAEEGADRPARIKLVA